MKFGIISILFLSLIACGEIGFTEDQTTVISKVLSDYGNDVSVSKGVRNENGRKTTYLNLIVHNADFEFIEKERLDLICSDIAFSINSRFTEFGSTINSYDVELKSNNNFTHRKPFSKTLLDEMVKFKDKFDEMSLLVEENETEQLNNYFEPSDTLVVDSEDLRAYLDAVAVEFGTIDTLIFQGFTLGSSSQKPFRTVNMVGKHARVTEETYFEVNFDRDTEFVVGFGM